MHAISIKAVLLATLAVMGVDIISGMMLLGIYAPGLSSSMTEQQLQVALMRLMQNHQYVTVSLILGAASTVLGGYLAARLAGIVPYFNALAFGAVAVAIGALFSGDLPTWYRVIAIGITIPAALLGAHLAKRRMQSVENER
jgi:hypothetical protein